MSRVQIPDFPHQFWSFFHSFQCLGKIKASIYPQNFPLKPRNLKNWKYFVLPSGPLWYVYSYHFRNENLVTDLPNGLMPRTSARTKRFLSRTKPKLSWTKFFCPWQNILSMAKKSISALEKFLKMTFLD